MGVDLLFARIQRMRWPGPAQLPVKKTAVSIGGRSAGIGFGDEPQGCFAWALESLLRYVFRRASDSSKVR